VREHTVALSRLPPPLDGLRLLQLSDLHLDEDARLVDALLERVEGLRYDAVVLTGDYRVGTSGPVEPTLAELARLQAALAAPAYAVLGNHDSVRMLPGLEALGIRVLLNEHATLEHGGAQLYLAGVDDPHYYRMDDLARAQAGIPAGAVTVLLSHSPELYREAAASDVDLFLCGHTHGGQICLPGGIAVILEARIPRRLGAGPWRQGAMRGYTSRGVGTSVVDVRFNCPPEITLHTLRRA